MNDIISAHGIGGAKDLPIPPELAIAGATAALTVSFIVLALAWRTPHFDSRTQGTPAPGWLKRLVAAPAFGTTLQVLGLAFFAYVCWAALAGPDLLTNPVFGVVYVILWVGVVPASLAFGPFFKAVSPIRTLHQLFAKATRTDPDEGLRALPGWVGYWPAALGLFAFVWLELVYPSATYLGPVRLWFAIYLMIAFVGAVLFGRRWLARADPFEVYSTLVGHLSFFGYRDRPGPNGRFPEPRAGQQAEQELVVRAPLRNLDAVLVRPGLVGVIAVMLGSTAFDTFKDSSAWVSFVQSQDMNTQLLNTLALVVFCLVVFGTFTAATLAVEPRPELGLARRDMPGQFAHALVPIVVGYITAHYLSYFLEVGQQTLIQLSDPMGTGANLLGTSHWSVNYWISEHPTLLATLKVLAIVGGHVLGVISSHDRAIRMLPTKHQLTGQLPLLVLMVAYTATGLYLLFGA